MKLLCEGNDFDDFFWAGLPYKLARAFGVVVVTGQVEKPDGNSLTVYNGTTGPDSYLLFICHFD